MWFNSDKWFISNQFKCLGDLGSLFLMFLCAFWRFHLVRVWNKRSGVPVSEDLLYKNGISTVLDIIAVLGFCTSNRSWIKRNCRTVRAAVTVSGLHDKTVDIEREILHFCVFSYGIFVRRNMCRYLSNRHIVSPAICEKCRFFKLREKHFKGNLSALVDPIDFFFAFFREKRI